ncbi:hypothetical protein F2Q68_00037156 [Brassica cretica]|uniref:Uncharacterized protein n=1 Tax=Brassica cretica TaxID=69181 RepID=A0A8S9H150_BRACR|nr:hypothetical protein F2Q68_00037156 [Brassica cretica]
MSSKGWCLDHENIFMSLSLHTTKIHFPPDCREFGITVTLKPHQVEGVSWLMYKYLLGVNVLLDQNRTRTGADIFKCFSLYSSHVEPLSRCLVEAPELQSWDGGFCTMSLQALCFSPSSSSKVTFSLDLNISFGVLRLSRLVPSPLSVDQSGAALNDHEKKIKDWCPRIEGT